MNKLHAKHVSASEAGGEYFQVVFEEEWDSDKAYFLIQRQFEMPDDGEPVVDIVFLCRYKAGVPKIVSLEEVSVIEWMTAQEVLENGSTPLWTRQSIELAEKKRLQKGW